MLQWQTIELEVEGLSQKHDDRKLPAGRLSVCQNMEFDTIGRLEKRRGYRKVGLTSTSSSHTADSLFIELGQLNDELLLIGYNYVWSLASADSLAHRTASITRRGPTLRGNMRRHDVASGSVATEDFFVS